MPKRKIGYKKMKRMLIRLWRLQRHWNVEIQRLNSLNFKNLLWRNALRAKVRCFKKTNKKFLKTLKNFLHHDFRSSQADTGLYCETTDTGLRLAACRLTSVIRQTPLAVNPRRQHNNHYRIKAKVLLSTAVHCASIAETIGIVTGCSH